MKKEPDDFYKTITTTVQATTRKLKAKWSVEMAKDLRAFRRISKNRSRRPSNVQESNALFELSAKFNELYPIGSTVHIDETAFLGIYDTLVPKLIPMKVLSDGVVLIDKCAVGFISSESKDDTDWYFVDDIEEYNEALKP